MNQVYDGSLKTVSRMTAPPGLSPVNVSFTGTPLKAGSYPVTATLNHPDYQGSANATLVIAKAQPSITFTGAPPCAAKKHAQMLAGADQVIGTLGCSSNP